MKKALLTIGFLFIVLSSIAQTTFSVDVHKGKGFNDNTWYTYTFTCDQESKDFGITPTIAFGGNSIEIYDFPRWIDNKYTF